MPEPLTAIRNVGPKMAAALQRAGIADAEALREIGADAAYAKLIAGGQRPHFIGYYVLVMGLQGRPWNDCQGAEKDALRARFDALKAETPSDDADPARTRLEAQLDIIGVIPRDRR